MALTGTPIQNSEEDLFSLIKFLQIQPYCEWQCFDRDIGKPLKRGFNSSKAIHRLQIVFKSMALRRTVRSTLDGQPILQLIEKEVKIEHIELSKDERAYYSALEKQTQLQFNKYLKAGTVLKNYTYILVLLLRLRQACDHPWLLKDAMQKITVHDVENVSKSNGKTISSATYMERIYAENLKRLKPAGNESYKKFQ